MTAPATKAALMALETLHGEAREIRDTYEADTPYHDAARVLMRACASSIARLRSTPPAAEPAGEDLRWLIEDDDGPATTYIGINPSGCGLTTTMNVEKALQFRTEAAAQAVVDAPTHVGPSREKWAVRGHIWIPAPAEPACICDDYAAVTGALHPDCPKHAEPAPAETDAHCVDCCCARSWKALGVSEYNGRSIPEEIEAQLAAAEARGYERGKIDGAVEGYRARLNDETNGALANIEREAEAKGRASAEARVARLRAFVEKGAQLEWAIPEIRKAFAAAAAAVAEDDAEAQR